MTDFDPARSLIARVRRTHSQVPEMIRGAKVPYHRRAEMSIPAFKLRGDGDPEVEGRAQSLRMMGKAAIFPIDFFFYDLEDACPDNPDLKPMARSFLIEAFETLDFGSRVRAFRPNNVRTQTFEDDMVEVVGRVGDRLDAIVLPKTESVDEVADVIEVVKTVQRCAGRDRTIPLEVLIESPRAFVDAERIAALDGVSALVFGAWDFARTIGALVDPDTWLEDQGAARQLLPIIAAAYGKDAVDAVTATLPLRSADDPDGTRYQAAIELAARDAQNARRLGYAAKWILHPAQIEPIQGAWTPTRDVALTALNLTAVYARAALAGSGAEVHGGALADKAVVGTEWWHVLAGIRAGVLTDDDIAATGLGLDVLERTVRTRD